MVADLPEEIEVMARTSDNIPMAIKVQNRAIYGVQFHPEACSGPKDTEFLFDRFCELMQKGRN